MKFKLFTIVSLLLGQHALSGEIRIKDGFLENCDQKGCEKIMTVVPKYLEGDFQGKDIKGIVYTLHMRSDGVFSLKFDDKEIHGDASYFGASRSGNTIWFQGTNFTGFENLLTGQAVVNIPLILHFNKGMFRVGLNLTDSYADVENTEEILLKRVNN